MGGREGEERKRMREGKQRDVLVVSNIVFKNINLVLKTVAIFF